MSLPKDHRPTLPGFATAAQPPYSGRSRWSLRLGFDGRQRSPAGARGVSKLPRAVLALTICACVSPLLAQAGHGRSFKTPPVKIPLNIAGHATDIVAWARVSVAGTGQGLYLLNVQLTADLSDLQRHMTEVLAAELNRDDRCGDRINIQNATLLPQPPALLFVVRLHYERWACAKLLGRQHAQKLIGGNAVLQVKLTPVIARDSSELRLVPRIGPIQADGSLGALLRSGDLGRRVRAKIQTSMASAMQKGTDFGLTLPPAIRSHLALQNAEFRPAGSEGLEAVVDGQVRITAQEWQSLSGHLARLGAR
ncbi:MAG: hypothetical protein ACRD2E_10270 [Terriglobales bacterium]